MNLYQLTSEEIKLDELLEGIIDEETGEILEVETFESLEKELEGKIENKVTSLIKIIKMSEAMSNARKEEIKKLQDLKKKDDAKVDRIKEMIHTYLKNTNKKKLECANGIFNLRKTTKVIIDDERLIPKDCIKTVIKETPIKAELNKKLKLGEVKGCHIEESTSISFK